MIKQVVEATDMVALCQHYTRLTTRDGGKTWVGRCPVHNGSGMSFTVEPEKGICGCSACGGAWGVIDLVMAVERATFDEAVRLLAARGGVALAPSPVQPASGEAIFTANDLAANYFSNVLTTTDEGRNIGLAYFRQRGINDQSVAAFNLGFAPEGRNHAHTALTAQGAEAATLTAAGLSGTTERGEHYDRFHGRVIYPVHTVGGRVVAFGARTLRSDKDVAKYVNSPESAIYSKSRELYGLYQAREAIVEKGFAILVEGYMDVISMHQAGVRNVVASSGTSLTSGQVALLRRFTDHVLVIYDSDAAGIKAAVRSIDMLLSADMDMHTVTLPPGEDPDSFARSHTPEQIEEYLREHATDMVNFRLSLLPEAVMRDPVERTRAIGQIIDSMALINDDNRRRTLIATLRNHSELRLSEKAIVTQVSRRILDNAARRADAARRREATRAFDEMEADAAAGAADRQASAMAVYLRPYEQSVVRYAVRYGVMILPNYSASTPEGELIPVTAIDLIDAEMRVDDLTFSNADLRHAFEQCMAILTDSDMLMRACDLYDAQASALHDQLMAQGVARLESENTDLAKLEALERKLAEDVEARASACYNDLCARHVASEFLISPDPTLRRIAAGALYTPQRVSNIYTRMIPEDENETKELHRKILTQIYCLKYAFLLWRLKEESEAMRRAGNDFAAIEQHMLTCQALSAKKKEFAQAVGDRVIAPPIS